jgi:hypothetical protein
VYINLGSADGLRRQVTFSVYDPKVNTLVLPDAAKLGTDAEEIKGPERKASIEVTKILGDHLAEARILEDDVSDPILPQDNIFTPAWRPGQKLQFALIGKMDLDGDRISDREKVRSMILANGGEIVFELLDNGKPAPGNRSINVNTRFLVIGDRPEETSDENVRKDFNNAIGAADSNGVQQISVKELTNYMGWKSTDRTVKLGTTGAADVDDKKKPSDSGFRVRPRPAAPADDAFDR